MDRMNRSGDKSRRTSPGMHTRGYLSGFAGLAVLALAGLTGCQAPPDTKPEAGIAAHIGLENDITFRTEASPLDEEPAPDRLSEAEAVQRAVTTDPGLQAALARVRVALAEADQARLLPNPVVNVVYRFDINSPGESQIEASLAQDFIQILMIPKRSSAADNRLRQAANDAVTVALDVVAQAQELYADAQGLEQLVAVLEERRGLLDKMRNVAQARLDAGEGARSDVSTLDSQRVELEVELADARLQLRETQIKLARAIGEPSGKAAWTLDKWTAPVLDGRRETDWVQLGLTRRPEIQSATWQLAALGDDVSLTGFLPWEGANVGIDAQKDGDWAVGPSISTPIPVFDMGQAKKAKATAEQIAARHELLAAKRKVVEEVRLAYQSLVDNQANLRRMRTELIPIQERRRIEAQDAYQAGQSDVTPLFLAEQDLRAAQAKAVQIELQTALALVRLHRAIGGASGAATPPEAASTQPVSLLR